MCSCHLEEQIKYLPQHKQSMLSIIVIQILCELMKCWNLQLHKIFSEQTELSELKVAEEEGEQGREIDSCTGRRENGENVKILQKKARKRNR